MRLDEDPAPGSCTTRVSSATRERRRINSPTTSITRAQSPTYTTTPRSGFTRGRCQTTTGSGSRVTAVTTTTRIPPFIPPSSPLAGGVFFQKKILKRVSVHISPRFLASTRLVLASRHQCCDGIHHVYPSQLSLDKVDDVPWPRRTTTTAGTTVTSARTW